MALSEKQMSSAATQAAVRPATIRVHRNTDNTKRLPAKIGRILATVRLTPNLSNIHPVIMVKYAARV
jgi:hypothetical protein